MSRVGGRGWPRAGDSSTQRPRAWRTGFGSELRWPSESAARSRGHARGGMLPAMSGRPRLWWRIPLGLACLILLGVGIYAWAARSRVDLLRTESTLICAYADSWVVLRWKEAREHPHFAARRPPMPHEPDWPPTDPRWQEMYDAMDDWPFRDGDFLYPGGFVESAAMLLPIVVSGAELASIRTLPHDRLDPQREIIRVRSWLLWPPLLAGVLPLLFAVRRRALERRRRRRSECRSCGYPIRIAGASRCSECGDLMS